MKKIIFRKIFPYDPTFSGKFTRYKGYSLITLQKESPSVEKNLIINCPSNIKKPIFCSSLKRGQETAKLVSKQLDIEKIEKSDLLTEIMFDLKKLLTKEEFEKFGSDLVRKRFMESFIEDQLTESRKHIRQRIDKILNKIKKLNEDNYLLISHSFFMKIVQIYQKDNRLFDQPGLLGVYFDPNEKTFNFGEGFEFNL